jgi:ribosomal protein L21E
MADPKEGDRVRIRTREQTEDDVKSQMYYPHYGGMTGVVQKVYSKAEVAIAVEMDSVSREIRKRHDDVRDQMKTKWLDGLSEEGRNRLTEREKDFNLRYVVLVAMSDLEKAGARPQPEPKVAAAKPSAEESSASEAPHRRTLAEIEADEEAELLRRAQRQG